MRCQTEGLIQPATSSKCVDCLSDRPSEQLCQGTVGGFAAACGDQCDRLSTLWNRTCVIVFVLDLFPWVSGEASSGGVSLHTYKMQTKDRWGWELPRSQLMWELDSGDGSANW
jgi:hypothetical protein